MIPSTVCILVSTKLCIDHYFHHTFLNLLKSLSTDELSMSHQLILHCQRAVRLRFIYLEPALLLGRFQVVRTCSLFDLMLFLTDRNLSGTNSSRSFILFCFRSLHIFLLFLLRKLRIKTSDISLFINYDTFLLVNSDQAKA